MYAVINCHSINFNCQLMLINYQLLFPAFLLGLISSFHCVGMCGPLAMALPIQHLSVVRRRVSIFLYHAGRMITYTLLGLLFGIVGRHIFIAGFQQWGSIILGSTILLVVVFQKLFTTFHTPPFIQSFTDTLHNIIRYLWGKHSASSSFLLGMTNGLLPCGMVYFALAGALSSATITSSVLFMILFGAGTLPLMLSVHFAGTTYLSLSFRNKTRKLVPFFIATMGMLLILRGLNLGIPYISPFLGNETGRVISCH